MVLGLGDGAGGEEGGGLLELRHGWLEIIIYIDQLPKHAQKQCSYSRSISCENCGGIKL